MKGNMKPTEQSEPNELALAASRFERNEQGDPGTLPKFEIWAPPLLCRIPQAAALIGRGVRFIYEAIANGTLEAVKNDARTLVVYQSLVAYAKSLPRAKIKPIQRRVPLRAGKPSTRTIS
jgi:hypothetical protein